MAERDKSRFSPPAVGGVSLLITFAVLCLTVFALLSLSSVRANPRLAEASAKAVEDYYAADCAAQEVLSRLRQGELPDNVQVDGDLYSYACPITDTQELQVEVRLEGEGWTVLRWQSARSGDWELEEELELWDGELF